MKTKKIDLVYIASPSYSGSTLLTFLLNAHPDIGTIGELKWGTIDLETYQCSCGELLTTCPHWKRIEQGTLAAGLPFDLLRPDTDFRFRENPFTDRIVRARNRGSVFEKVRDAAIAVMPVCKEQWQTITSVNRVIAESVLRLQGASLFVDASKDPVRLKHMINTGDYSVRVVQLVRDGRGVVNSAMKNKGETVEVAARDWALTHEQIERVCESPEVVAMRIRYEELCSNPGDTCDQLFAFLGLDPKLANPNFRTVEHHILGNSMRLRKETEIRLDEKWRTMLSEHDLAAFEGVAGQRNREYGYR